MQPGFADGPRDLWFVDGKTAGYSVASESLTFLTLLGAGHYVPTNQPRNALDMMNRFVTKQPYCIPESDYAIVPRSTLSLILPENSTLDRSETEQMSCRIGPRLCGINDCMGRGTCSPITGTCKCTLGFTGFDCSYNKIAIMEDQVPFSDKGRFIGQRDWIYFSAMVKSNQPVAHIMITQKMNPYVPYGGDDQKFDNTIGGGIGTIQPRYGLCVYGRADQEPTTTQFDVARCVNGWSTLTSRTRVYSSNDPTVFHFAVFNAHPYNLTFDLYFSLTEDEELNFLSIVYSSAEFWIPMGVSIGVILLLFGTTVFFGLRFYRVKNSPEYRAILE